MKRITVLIALLAMMTVLALGLAGCGSQSDEGGTEAAKDAAAGNWYIVDGQDISTLKLDGAGGGSLGGGTVSYTLDGETLSLTIDGEAIGLTMGDSEYGQVLTDGEGVIYAYRDKNAAKEIAAGSGTADEQEEESETPSDTSAAKDYYGEWVGDRFSYNGVDMSLDEAGMTFSIVIEENGTAKAITNGESDGSATWVLNDDGSITLTDASGELKPTYIDGDGILHLTLQADEGDLIFLCHKK